MPAKHLDATVRQESSIAVINLTGEINGFAQEVLEGKTERLLRALSLRSELC